MRRNMRKSLSKQNPKREGNYYTKTQPSRNYLDAVRLYIFSRRTNCTSWRNMTISQNIQ